MNLKAEMDMQMMVEIYKAIEALGGDLNLLTAIGTYGDATKDPSILQTLRKWNLLRAAEPALSDEKLPWLDCSQDGAWI